MKTWRPRGFEKKNITPRPGSIDRNVVSIADEWIVTTGWLQKSGFLTVPICGEGNNGPFSTMGGCK